MRFLSNMCANEINIDYLHCQYETSPISLSCIFSHLNFNFMLKSTHKCTQMIISLSNLNLWFLIKFQFIESSTNKSALRSRVLRLLMNYALSLYAISIRYFISVLGYKRYFSTPQELIIKSWVIKPQQALSIKTKHQH